MIDVFDEYENLLFEKIRDIIMIVLYILFKKNLDITNDFNQLQKK